MPFDDWFFDNKSLGRVKSLAHELTHLGQELHEPSYDSGIANDYEAYLTAFVVFDQLADLNNLGDNYYQNINGYNDIYLQAIDALQINMRGQDHGHFKMAGLVYFMKNSPYVTAKGLSPGQNREFLFISPYDVLGILYGN